MKITNHTEILNALIEKHNLKSYLEIGVQNRANNFNKIGLPWREKFCIDPDPNAKADFVGTSDEYFKELNNKWDIVFIDGLHECQQVKRDFENSLKCLNDGGYILIHDVLPQNEVGTRVPRETLVWWGDVYKFAMSIRNHYSDIGFVTYNIDNGCMVVWKELNKTYTTWNEAPFNWETYQKYGRILLNVVDEVII
jgi:hypothetical protein